MVSYPSLATDNLARCTTVQLAPSFLLLLLSPLACPVSLAQTCTADNQKKVYVAHKKLILLAQAAGKTKTKVQLTGQTK